MNAKSQETPVGDRVDEFLNRMGALVWEIMTSQQ